MIHSSFMRQLRSIDEVAYVRFASVYRSFRDINEFMDELKDLLDAKALTAVPEAPEVDASTDGGAPKPGADPGPRDVEGDDA